jgi:hypothetical protein
MPSFTPAQLLDPLTVSRAESLGLAARFIVEGYMAGEHKSPYRGFAIEFAQHREYTHGDDTRHLDWKVLGRTDRYYIKQYEQETNYVAHLLLDGSESMRYGSGPLTKLHCGKMLAACLAYLVLHQQPLDGPVHQPGASADFRNLHGPTGHQRDAVLPPATSTVVRSAGHSVPADRLCRS